MKTSRQTAVEALCQVEKNKAWSNLALDSALERAKLKEQDRGFATALFYGTLIYRYQIDSCIRTLTKTPIRKMDVEVRNILRTGIYQMLYLDSVPDHAAVSESVNLARQMKKSSAGGFINAVLRGFLRTDKAIPLAKSGKTADRLAVEYSCPPKLVNIWLKAYGGKKTEAILKNSLMAPPTFIRVNTLKNSREELIADLAAQGISAKPLSFLENGCVVERGSGNLHETKIYKEGRFHIQDISSQLAAGAVDAKPGQRVLDCCAAPGGKTFIIAQQMNNTGEIVACDLHQKRADEIIRRKNTLGLTNISAKVLDMSEYHEELGEFDRVLCDVPCSGYGTIRRRPEIKYQDPDEFKTLPETQLALLSNGSKYCKKGGKLLYSTCTLSPLENQKVVEKFLENHRDFSALKLDLPIKTEDNGTILLGEQGGDGFFINAFVKN